MCAGDGDGDGDSDADGLVAVATAGSTDDALLVAVVTDDALLVAVGLLLGLYENVLIEDRPRAILLPLDLRLAFVERYVTLDGAHVQFDAWQAPSQ